jgi:hypothetical protein
MAQVQHNMRVTHSREAVLSIVTGACKWVEMTILMNLLYLTVLVSAEKEFWLGYCYWERRIVRSS